MATDAATLSRRLTAYFSSNSGAIFQFLPGLLLWFAFVKLPATAGADQPPQSWEAVLSFAAARHWQWGRDIVFTYGPLGFLTSDYYWGNHFLPVLLWSFGFSLVLTMVLLRFLKRVILPVRILLYVGLPLLTVPRSADLGIDPIYLFAITLFGIAGFPAERPGVPLLIVLGSMLGVLSLVKFTFCLYGVVALLAMTAAHGLRRSLWPAGVVLASSAASFLAAWWLAGQNFSNIGPWFQHSAQIAAGYTPAMSLPPSDPDLVVVALVGLCLAGLLVIHWRGSSGKTLAIAPRIGLLAAGTFLAWKEGLVRADEIHVVTFLLYAFLIAALMPALLGLAREGRPRLVPVTAITLAIGLAPFAMPDPAFVDAMENGALPRLADTFTALVNPVRFKHRLEANLESRRSLVRLPRIAEIVADAPVGVLNYDQDVAILNGFDYRPHPVFQTYSAYTPELQRLNAAFFDSKQAPGYVLWRYGTIGRRFPTLDDGQILLSILGAYQPVIKEGEFVLWKRDASRDSIYTFGSPEETLGSPGQWIPIPAGATWLSIELHETWLGAAGSFFCRASMPTIEVRLEDGRTLAGNLPPGNARAGFVVNPLLVSEADLRLPFSKAGTPLRVTAARVFWDRWCFGGSIRFITQQIQGIPALEYAPDAGNAPVIPAPSPATAP